MADQITDALDFLEKVIGEPEVIIKFIKRTTKELRVMRLTLDFSRIPEAKKPKTVNLKQILSLVKNNKIMRVFDLEKQEWRSIPLDSIEWLVDSQRKIFRISL